MTDESQQFARDGIEENYLIDLHKKAGSNRLLVLFSSSLKPAFSTYEFDCNVLYIADLQLTYYVKMANELASVISAAAHELSCASIVLVGGSKGGFGALLHASIGSRQQGGAAYHAIVFGPQTLVYPKNDNIHFPSYIRLLDRAASDREIRSELVSFGRIPTGDKSRISADIYFSAFNDADRIEAMRVTGAGVTHHPLPMSGHLSHFPFVVDCTDAVAVNALLDEAFAQGKAIGDNADEQRATYLVELMGMPARPDIAELVDDAFSSMALR